MTTTYNQDFCYRQWDLAIHQITTLSEGRVKEMVDKLKDHKGYIEELERRIERSAMLGNPPETVKLCEEWTKAHKWGLEIIK